MLVGAYPFEDPRDPRNFRKTISVSPETSDHLHFDKNKIDPHLNIFSNYYGGTSVILILLYIMCYML
jgi:hypothetical protein